MAAQAIRDTAIQSIQNVFNYTEQNEFQDRTIEEVQLRMEYLHEAFERFSNNHQVLLQRAVNAGEQDDADEQRELFERIEENYLATRMRIQNRLNQLYQIDQQEHNNNDQEDGIEHDEEIQSVHNENRENDAISDIGSEPTPRMIANNPTPAENSQFSNLVERMCMSMANKKENTWGKYDGDLSKWQGFHDAFKAAVHDDDLIAPTFKLQFLKSSLEGRAVREFGEWPGGNENYQLAWEWLNQQNQQDYTTSKTILWRLLGFTKMDRPSGNAIQKLCTITQGVMRQLQAMKFPVQHYDMIIIHIVHDKLDAETSKDWELSRKSETPTITELTEFLQSRERALINAQISEKKGLPDGKKRSFSGKEHHYHENKRMKQSSSDTNNHNDNASKKPTDKKCKMCDEIHFANQCKKFRGLPLKDRKSKVRELNLCYNCLSPFHLVRDCTASPCNRCKTKHHHLLCNENPLNKTVNTAQVKDKKKNKKAMKKETNQA